MALVRNLVLVNMLASTCSRCVIYGCASKFYVLIVLFYAHSRANFPAQERLFPAQERPKCTIFGVGSLCSHFSPFYFGAVCVLFLSWCALVARLLRARRLVGRILHPPLATLLSGPYAVFQIAPSDGSISSHC